MIDRALIRENPEKVRIALKNRGYDTTIVDEIIGVDHEWKTSKKMEEELRAKKNKLSLLINEKKKKNKPVDKEVESSRQITEEIEKIQKIKEQLEDRFERMLLVIPNIPSDDTPLGKSEEENVEIRKWGTPKKTSKDVLSHYEFGHRYGLIDFESGVKLACHRFVVLKGWIAKLERALINFMLNVNVSRGYVEILPPFLVNTKTMRGTGQLPKFEEELYKCRDDDLWMIPTSEVPLVNLFMDRILEERDLPINVTAYSPCFRREAGAYGKDIKGMIRQHQFDKVELVKITTPETSYDEHEKLVRDSEYILQLLELPYRIIQLCTADLGFASAKTYDIEVWIPGQDKYREIASCSNCIDFQARRTNIKFRRGGLQFVHTLNGSSLAVGRTLIAVLENYQENRVFIVPKVLRDYMGIDRIEFE